MKVRMVLFGQAVVHFVNKYYIAFSALVAAACAGALALYNVSMGPLHNLNDIGGWSNRALFILMTAGVHALLLMLCALFSRRGFARMVLRQLIVTAGFYIMLMAINHKTYYYINVLQPLIRAMDMGGLAAGVSMESALSAPALEFIYLITRGPVYDMYLLKLFSVGCYILLSLLIVRFADRRGLGIRSEVLLALCMILPQGFMNAACSATTEIASLMLLAISLTFMLGMEKTKPTASMVCYGMACALNGVCLYAIAAYVWMLKKKHITLKHMAIVPTLMMVLCIPSVLSGMGIGSAIFSLFEANLGLPAYAAGSPNVFNIIPRALVTETPQYAPILRHLPSLDFQTNAQQFYTAAHFASVSNGFALAALAGYMGLCAWVHSMETKTSLHRVMILTLGALILCPNVTAGAWLGIDLLCLYAILAQSKLRLPACMILFSTAAGSCYPMTEEVLVPMVFTFVLCLLALLMLTGVIPTQKEEAANE